MDCSNPSPQIVDQDSSILVHQEVGPGIYKLRLLCPSIAIQAKAGQFVQIHLSKSHTPLLRRPFSLYQTHHKEGWIEILYKVYGEGTLLLSQKKLSEKILVLGPLGRPWKRFSTTTPCLLLGGGVGVVPLYFLAKELEKEKISFGIALGIRNQGEEKLVEDFKEFSVPLEIFTEDGSLGKKGIVTEILKREKPGPLYICGPSAMLKAILNMPASKSWIGQISLEERMPCGFGICYGCVVYSLKEKRYLRSCIEGPAFDLTEIELH